MTEIELLQLQSDYGEAFATTVMNFISILSGFLLANHFLGSKINNTQFIIMLLTLLHWVSVLARTTADCDPG
jgi:hypothetical protein